MEKKLLEKLQKIKLLAMDVDGTLTNAKVYYSKNGEEFKKFSIRDGMGIELLRRNDIMCAIVTSENSQIVIARANKLKIEHLILGSHNKKRDIIDLAKNLNLELDEVAFIGDDVNDIHPMQIVGASACPADSVEEVKKIVDYVCTRNGGNGAVREFCDLILIAQNKPIILPENW